MQTRSRQSHKSGASRRAPTVRSRFGLVVETSQRKVMWPRQRVNPATAFMTGCALAALANAAPVGRRRFLAFRGFTSDAAGRFPEAMEETVTSQISGLLAAALREPDDSATASLSLQPHTIQLRLFGDSVTAREWAETPVTPVEREPRKIVQREARDAISRVRQAAAAAAASLPAGFTARQAALAAMHDQVRGVIAESLAPALNVKAASLPQRTYEDKKALAKWVNAELRRLGLAIRCPKTRHPCLLIANAGHDPAVGRFHLEYTDAEGRRHRTVTSTELPHLEPMINDLSRAVYGERTSRSR